MTKGYGGGPTALSVKSGGNPPIDRSPFGPKLTSRIPFDIKRVYYLYNVPADAERGGHAHRELEQVLFALSGSFRVKIVDGEETSEYWLRDPSKGLYIGRLIWHEMDCFSHGAVCMVLASERYDEADYFRDHAEFLTAVREAS